MPKGARGTGAGRGKKMHWELWFSWVEGKV